MKCNIFSKKVYILFAKHFLDGDQYFFEELKSEIKVRFLGFNEEVIRQIIRILSTDYLEETITAVNLVARSVLGGLYLGNTKFSFTPFPQYPQHLRSWFFPPYVKTQNLASLYPYRFPQLFPSSDHVAVSDAGTELITKLQHRTRATVTMAAFDTITFPKTQTDLFHPRELILLDTSVADYKTILDDLQVQSNTREVILLDCNKDGVEELAIILLNYQEHILSHCDTSNLFLDSDALKLDLHKRNVFALKVISRRCRCVALHLQILPRRRVHCDSVPGLRGTIATSKPPISARELCGDWTSDLQIGAVKTQHLGAFRFLCKHPFFDEKCRAPGG